MKTFENIFLKHGKTIPDSLWLKALKEMMLGLFSKFIFDLLEIQKKDKVDEKALQF